MTTQRTLLAVHAHPDDECITTGGILARYAAEGVRTVLVTCTDGAVGEISDPALASPENLAEVRARELDQAVRILNVSRLVKLGYRDSGMAGTSDNMHPASFHQARLEEAVERVVRIMREEHPQVVVTYDERGGYGHPDHIRAHQVAVAAFEAAGDASRFASAGPAWAPAKLYYAVFPRSAMEQFVQRLRAAGIEPPFEREPDAQRDQNQQPPFGVPDEQVTTSVDVSAYVEAKHAALASHRTQMGPEMFFMRLPPDLFADAFGRETFQRVAGPGGSHESDLFEDLAD
jgi:mycothiol conjugate amidase Mca